MMDNDQTYLYLPLVVTRPLMSAAVIVRAHEDPKRLAPALRAEVRAIDANVLAEIRPFEEVLEFRLLPFRVIAFVGSALGIWRCCWPRSEFTASSPTW